MGVSNVESTLGLEDVFATRRFAQTSFAVITDIVEQRTII
jgi:hypothetical protein